jgi:hypothetical protein
MARPKGAATPKEKNGNGGANLGFEEKLWLAADKLRGSVHRCWRSQARSVMAFAIDFFAGGLKLASVAARRRIVTNY